MSQIRKATAADAPAVFALAAEFATTFQLDADVFESSFSRLIEQDSALLLVNEQSGTVAGYLLGFNHDTLFANGTVAWIEELMVSADRRRNGIGKRLVADFERWAHSRNAKMIALATRRAMPFYGAIGYEESAVYFRKLL